MFNNIAEFASRKIEKSRHVMTPHIHVKQYSQKTLERKIKHFKLKCFVQKLKWNLNQNKT